MTLYKRSLLSFLLAISIQSCFLLPNPDKPKQRIIYEATDLADDPGLHDRIKLINDSTLVNYGQGPNKPPVATNAKNPFKRADVAVYARTSYNDRDIGPAKMRVFGDESGSKEFILSQKSSDGEYQYGWYRVSDVSGKLIHIAFTNDFSYSGSGMIAKGDRNLEVRRVIVTQK